MSAMTRNLKLTIAYDGTGYLGWQKTRMGPSIEEELEQALEQLLRHSVALQAASRTDAGVHAERQIVNFFSNSRLECWRIQRGVNTLLPADIRVHIVEEVEGRFHPTLDAQAKCYLYRISTERVQMPHLRHLSWHVPFPLKFAAMQEAAQHLIGEKDFTALSNRRKGEKDDRVCCIHSIAFEEWEGGLQIAIVGDRFLYKMVRNIVGTLVDVGLGKLKNVEQILASRNRPHAGVTAPAHGLSLYQVLYCSNPI